MIISNSMFLFIKTMIISNSTFLFIKTMTIKQFYFSIKIDFYIMYELMPRTFKLGKKITDFIELFPQIKEICEEYDINAIIDNKSFHHLMQFYPCVFQYHDFKFIIYFSYTQLSNKLYIITKLHDYEMIYSDDNLRIVCDIICSYVYIYENIKDIYNVKCVIENDNKYMDICDKYKPIYCILINNDFKGFSVLDYKKCETHNFTIYEEEYYENILKMIKN